MMTCSGDGGQRGSAADEILPDIQEEIAALRVQLVNTESHLAIQLTTLLELAQRMNRPDLITEIERIQTMADAGERARALERLQTM